MNQSKLLQITCICSYYIHIYTKYVSNTLKYNKKQISKLTIKTKILHNNTLFTHYRKYSILDKGDAVIETSSF
jgi:hypothetical protein